MFRLYRQPTKGEFFVVFGDCAQGGSDSNYVQFLSKTHIDIPLVLQMPGVAANMTPQLHQALEWIYRVTGIEPVVALERQMGGSSEMERLRVLNRVNHYRLYKAKTFGNTDGEQQSERLGWDTNSATRPKMLGDWKVAYDNKLVKVYDEETISQHSKFIVNKSGKPEAAANAHDDAVMSAAGAWQLYQTEEPEMSFNAMHYQPDPAMQELWNEI